MRLLVFFFQLFIIASSLFASDRSTLPEPYRSARLMPFNPHGWHINSQRLEEVINRKKTKVVVEIGSWMGLSTRDIARLLPEEGVVYAVDTWKGAPEKFHDPDFLGSPDTLATLYDQFLSNVIHANLTHKIVPIQLESTKAATIFPIYPDLVYIDACHTYEAVTLDLEAWWPFVRGHGNLCGDDYYYRPDVKRAVTEFAEKNNLKVQGIGNFWLLEE